MHSWVGVAAKVIYDGARNDGAEGCLRGVPLQNIASQPHLLRDDNVMSRHIPSWHGASCDRVSYHVKPLRYHLDEVCTPPLCSFVLDMRDTDRFRKSEAHRSSDLEAHFL